MTKRQICTKETSCKKFSSTFVGSIFSACLCVQFHTIIMAGKSVTLSCQCNGGRVGKKQCQGTPIILPPIYRQERAYLCYTGPTLFPAYITLVSYTTLPPL